MAYVKWFFLLIVGIPFELFAKVLSPVLACFVQANGWLPDWLWMFQTPDNTNDGDAGHRERWPRDGVIWTWLRRTAWLFRNSAYGFNFYVLGVKYLPTDVVTVEGDPAVGDTSGISGLCKWRLERDGKLYAW